MLEAIREFFERTNLVLAAFVAALAIAAGISPGLKRWRARRAYLAERRRRHEQVLALADLATALQELPTAIATINSQLNPNGGQSLADKVDRIDATICMMSRRFDLSMAQSNMASATTNPAGEVIDVSRALQRQTGRHADELIGRGWYDSIDREERARVIVRWEEAVRDGREFEHVFSWRRPDGTLPLVRFVGWPVRPPPGGKVTGYVIIAAKIDPVKWSEEQDRAHATRKWRGEPEREIDDEPIS